MILLLCIIIVAGIKPGPEGMFCTEKEFTHCCKLVNNLSLLEDLEYSNSSQWRKAGDTHAWISLMTSSFNKQARVVCKSEILPASDNTE